MASIAKLKGWGGMRMVGASPFETAALCRPCESRGPYILRGRCYWKRHGNKNHTKPTSAGGYGSLRSQGRRGMDFRIQLSSSVRMRVRDLAAHCARGLHLRLALFEIRGR